VPLPEYSLVLLLFEEREPPAQVAWFFGFNAGHGVASNFPPFTRVSLSSREDLSSEPFFELFFEGINENISFS